MVTLVSLLALLAAPPSSIVVAGESFDVGRPVVLWSDPQKGFNGYSEECVEESAITQASVCCAKPFKSIPGRRSRISLA